MADPAGRFAGGPCFLSQQFRGAPVCPVGVPTCPTHHWQRPKVAYVIAGMARSFLDERGWLTYLQHVIKSFHSNPESRAFLHLKIARGAGMDWRWKQLGLAVDALRPAVIKTTLERDVDIKESLLDLTDKQSAHDANAWARVRRLRHPECFWADEKVNNFVLSRASVWWYTMAQAWESVEQYERDHSYRFEAVVFSRPDIVFHASMGPWCAYELRRQWYAPWGETTPDMFWIFPRELASRILTTWTKVVLPCAPGQPCCNLTTRPNETIHGRDPRAGMSTAAGSRVTYSNWLVTYWSRILAEEGILVDGGAGAGGGGGRGAAISATLNHTLRGYGQVAANPARVIYGKPRRNCTMHLGCVPRHKTMDVWRGNGFL